MKYGRDWTSRTTKNPWMPNAINKAGSAAEPLSARATGHFSPLSDLSIDARRPELQRNRTLVDPSEASPAFITEDARELKSSTSTSGRDFAY